MDILSDVSDTLAALLADRGAGDATFQRMVSVYRDVTDLLGCRDDYDCMVASLLSMGKSDDKTAGHMMGARLPPCIRGRS